MLSIRAAMDRAVGAYVQDHYPHGVWLVCPVAEKDKEKEKSGGADLVVLIVSNKYSPANFWYIHLYIYHCSYDSLDSWID